MEKRQEKCDGLTRRGFVKAAAITGASVAASSIVGCSPTKEATIEASGEGTDPFANAAVYYATCPPECQHHSLKGFVVDGKLVKVESGEANESKACLRGLSRAQMVNDPNRLTTPLLRDGNKGSNKWKEISWDEAFDLIEEKFNETLSTKGNQSIAFDSFSGNWGSLVNGPAGAFFSYLGGYTGFSCNLCCAAIDAAMIPICGRRSYDTRNQIENSDYIIAWGSNPVISMQSYFQRFEKAVANGGKMVTIDPRFSETASKSQEWLAPWPGSDSAIALAIIKIIIEENLYDVEYLLAHTTAPCLIDIQKDAPALQDEKDPASYLVYDKTSQMLVKHDSPGINAALSVTGTQYENQYVTQFDLVYAEAKPWDANAVEAESGVSAEDISRIAHDLAAAEHVMIIQNMPGAGRTENGAYAIATQIYISLLTGNIGHEGDGIYDAAGVSSYIEVGGAIPSKEGNPEYPPIYRPSFGTKILADDPVPIDIMWIMTANPMTQWPNTNLVKQGLQKIPFVIVADQYMTSTALYADLVLPITAVFETDDVIATGRNHFIQICEKAVQGPGEAKSDLEIFTELSKRFGFGEVFDHTPEELIRNVLKPTGITYEELKEKKAIDPVDPNFIPFKDGEFVTPSKKAEFWIGSWKEEGYSPIATHTRPVESPLNDSELAQKYPLASVQKKTRRSVHSTFNNLAWMDELEGKSAFVEIHPADAEVRGISDGDKVVVFNDRGEHPCVAQILDQVKEGVVILENGWWEQQGGSSSYVTNNLEKTLGSIHCCNSTLVEIRKEA